MRARFGILAVATLTLAACGSTNTSSPSTGSSDAASQPSATASAAATTAAFDAPFTLGGATVTISAPKSFTPGAYASNFMPGQVAELVTVDIANKGTTPLDMTTIVLSATSGQNACSDVLDGDNGINGAPTDPVAAGGHTTFKYGIACDGKMGDPLDLNVAFGSASVDLTSKLA